jgi:hypothetical protein
MPQEGEMVWCDKDIGRLEKPACFVAVDIEQGESGQT